MRGILFINVLLAQGRLYQRGCPMRSIAYSALCLLSVAVGASAVAFAQGPSSGQILPGSRVVIAPMGGFETYFAAAVREKEMPIILTLDKDSAQYFVVSTETEWQGFVWIDRKCIYI